MKKINKNADRSHSVIYSWILSYLLLTFLNALLTGGVYVVARNMIDTEINRANRLVLTNIRNNLDMALKAADDLSIDILSSPQIQSISRMEPGEPRFYYTLYQAAQSLSNNRSSQFLFRYYYIYLGNSDRILIPGTAYSSRLYYDSYIAEGQLSYEEWAEILSKTHYGSYHPLPYFSSSAHAPLELALVRTIPPVSSHDKVANIVIMMNFSDIRQYAKDDYNLVLLDQNNRVVAQSKPETPFDPTVLPDMPDEYGIVSCDSSEGEEIISYITSTNGQWKYITVTPEKVYWEKAAFIRAIMAGEIILCMLGMGLLSAYFIQRDYNILREITQFIRSQFHVDTGHRENEYHLIQQVLSSTLQGKQEAELKLDRQAGILRANLLISLLEGGDCTRNPDLEKELFGARFSEGEFDIIVFHFEPAGLDYWSRGRKNEVDALAWYAAANVAGELLGQLGAVYPISLEERMVCVLCAGERREYRPRLSAKLEEILDLAGEKLHIRMRAAVAGPHRLEDIHRGYTQALSALDYFADTNSAPVFYEDVPEKIPARLFYPYDEEHKLVNHLQTGNKEEALRTMSQLLDHLAAHPRDLTSSIPFILASNILQTLTSNQEGRSASLERYSGELARLQHCRTLKEAKEPLEALILGIIRDRAESSGRNMPTLGAEIKQIIRKQYTDPELCISSIALQLDKSPYYISKVFKQEMGCSILDFINQARICRAKELMLSTDATQELVAQMTGFSNVRTFQRVFKKVEGTSPGRLRAALETQTSSAGGNTPPREP